MVQKTIFTKKAIREASRCANCIANKSRFLKQKSNKNSNKKSDIEKINPIFHIYIEIKVAIKYVVILFEVQKM